MKLKLYANLRDIVGKDELEMEIKEPVLLSDFLKDLSDNYGEQMRRFLFKETNEIADSLIISINGEIIKKNGSIFLSNKDDLSILLPLAGG
jgi:MoaD family protein